MISNDDQRFVASIRYGTLPQGWNIHPSFWWNGLGLVIGSFSYWAFFQPRTIAPKTSRSIVAESLSKKWAEPFVLGCYLEK